MASLKDSRVRIAVAASAALILYYIYKKSKSEQKLVADSDKPLEVLWKDISVETIKADLKSITEKTEALKADLLAASTSALAADRIRAGTPAAKVNKGKPLSANPEDDFALIACLVTTPFSKMNPSNARAKFMDHVHVDEKIREQARLARGAITNIKREFFQDEKVYNAIGETLKRIERNNTQESVFATGLLRKFNQNGLFHVTDKTVRERIQRLVKETSEIESLWKKNLQESVDKTEFLLERKELDGVPENVLQSMEKSEGKYKVNLSYPHVSAIYDFCSVRSTRELIYRHFKLRGGEENEKLMLQLAQLRFQIAQLQGFPSYAALVLSRNRMARTVIEVNSFLDGLESKTRTLGQKQKDRVAKYVESKKDFFQIDQLRPWDVSYALNLMKEQELEMDVKLLGEYFPSDHVVTEVLKIYEKLLGLRFENFITQDKWHEDVQAYKVFQADKKGSHYLGCFYLDLFPRKGKYGHACVVNLINTPLVSKKPTIDCCAMLCNLSKEMSHDDVVTFFHEFGHVMHSICSKIGGKSAYAKVPKDFVEAPSQMLENWCWQSEMIKRLSRHAKTGQSMPDQMIKQLQHSKHWMSILPFRRQLFYNSFDVVIHSDKIPESVEQLAKIEREASVRIALSEVDEKMAKHSGLARNFGHTASQYSASYYSYLWSEVFSADMFATCFEEKSLTDPTMGVKYRDCILVPGGTEHPDEMLKKFLGRSPDDSAFVKQHLESDH